MARIRTIKPELIEDEKTASLEDGEWRLFVSLITLADDYGNLRANPKQIDGTVFWAKKDPTDVWGMLTTLSAAGLVQLYRVRGQSYAHILGWAKHQKVDHPGKPLCPGPSDADALIESEDRSEPRASEARPAREESASDSRLTGTGTGTNDLDLPLPVSSSPGLEASGSDAPARSNGGANRDQLADVTGYDLSCWFRNAWADVFSATWIQPPGVGKHATEFADSLMAIPVAERLVVLADVRPSMRTFLRSQDRDAVAAGHPFAFWTTRFSAMRSKKTEPVRNLVTAPANWPKAPRL